MDTADGVVGNLKHGKCEGNGVSWTRVDVKSEFCLATLQVNRMKAAPVRTIQDTTQQIDTLIFDLFGVLISFDDDIVYRRLAPHCEDPEAAFLALRGLVSQRDLIRGRKSLDQLHQQLVAAHGLALTRRDFEAAWLEPYSEPMPGMADLIRTLSKRYKLVLLSNVDKYYWQVVHKTHPEIACFDTLLLSWKLALAKPDPEMFLHALKAARSDAARCFFIDDKSENVEAARLVGIRGHRFLDVEHLTQALGEFGSV